jgi:hypothetical protein
VPPAAEAASLMFRLTLNEKVSRISPTLKTDAVMNQKWIVTFGAACALLLSGAVYGQNQKLPDGKGKAELIRGCTDCHSVNLVVQKKRTPEDWRKVVNDMAARTSESTPKDVDNIIRYLNTNFGIKKTGTTAATQSAPPSSSGAAAKH